MVDVQRVARAVRESETERNHLLRQDFTLTRGTSGSDSVVAEFSAPRPLALRNDKPVKLVVPARETFTEDGTANTETLNLTYDIIESTNSTDVVVRDESTGDYLTVSSVDYANNTVDVSTNGNANTLAVVYIASNPGKVRVQKQAPKSQGRVEETLFDENNKIVNVRDQQQTPFHLEATESDLQRVIPEDFAIQLEVNLPYVADLDYRNAVLQLPAEYLTDAPEGLGKAVAQDIIERA